MRSLRARLLVGVISGMALLLVVFSIIIYTVFRRALVNQFDASLAATARILAASVEYEGDEIELELDFQKMPEFQRVERPAYYQLWRDDGTVAARSPSLGTDNLLRLEGSLGVLVFQALQTGSGHPGRAVALKFRPKIEGRDADQQPANQQPLTVVVARDASGLHSNLQFLGWLLLIASVGTITLSFLFAVFVVRQGLSPLDSIATEIASVREDDLTTRIGTTSVPEEILPIKNRLNDLLSRLEDAFKRERRFTADVTHELRTPLAGIRSSIEVALTRARDTTEYRVVLSECLAIVENMQTMVNNLLMIARLDACQVTFRQEQTRLEKLVNSCWRCFSDKALERGIIFENRVPAEMTCESDPDSLSMVLSNLLDNAVEYTNEGGQIWTTGGQADDCVEITVANTGCQLTSEEISQVLECFWRHDSSRTDTGAHCGLGLALVQRLIRALGGCTTVEVQNGGVFTVRLVLPRPAKS